MAKLPPLLSMRPKPAARPTAAALLPALVGALLAAGCSPPRPVATAQPLESLAASPASATWSALAPQAALIRLPDGRDRAVGLRQRRQSEGLVQEIDLPARDGTGRNLLTIALHGEAAVQGLYPGKPSEAGVKAELAAAFPGRQFRISPQPRRNAFGLYGLAVSAGPDGQRCVYAWQWLDGDDRRVGGALGGAASWRARICRRTQTLDEIAAALDQIALGLAPEAAASPSVAPPEPVRERHARPAPASRQARAPNAPSALRTPASSTPAPARSLSLSVALPLPGADGRRYLAAPPTAPQRPAGLDRAHAGLDQSLPAEAYRGPNAGATAPPRGATRAAADAPRSIVPSPE